MKSCKRSSIVLVAIVFVISLWVSPDNVFAHCDTIDGPVIQDAKVALKKGDITPVLKWIKKEDEQEVRDAFRKTLRVREKGEEVREIADYYFFETLVRIHRAGEGAPYTGLKPAGSVEPAVAAADNALQTGSIDKLADKISNAVRNEIKRRFREVIDKKKRADKSVEAGREFVEAYVQYVHFIESIHNLVAKESEHQHARKHEH